MIIDNIYDGNYLIKYKFLKILLEVGEPEFQQEFITRNEIILLDFPSQYKKIIQVT